LANSNGDGRVVLVSAEGTAKNFSGRSLRPYTLKEILKESKRLSKIELELTKSINFINKLKKGHK
ncbi:MAG: hypothetical protein AABW81_04070, partial [Nanoarchaeota archaeon]